MAKLRNRETAERRHGEMAKLRNGKLPSRAFAISPFFKLAISPYAFASFQLSPTPTSTSNGTLSATA